MNSSKLFALSLILGLSVGSMMGCGSSDQVTLRILPSIGIHEKKIHSLSQDLFTSPISTAENFLTTLNSSNSCRQINVIAAVKEGNGDTGPLKTYPLSMRTYYPSSTPAPFNGAWLSTNGYTEFEQPIEIKVNKGIYVEVGMFGALNSPNTIGYPNDNSPADGVCDNFSGGTALPSYALMGHTVVGTPNGSITVPLNVFAFDATPASTPNPPPTWSNGSVSYAGAWVCDTANQNNISTCPLKDVVEIKNSPPYSGTFCRVFKVEGALNSNGGPVVDFNINDTSTYAVNRSFYVPHVYPIKITLFEPTSVAYATITLFDKKNFGLGYSDPLPAICNSNQILKVGNVGTL